MLAYAHPPNHHAPNDRIISRANGDEQIFLGRFISTPSPNELLIQEGAVLVSSADGRGVINAVAWNVSNPTAAIAALGAGNGTPVVTSNEQGFFFPGFIGSVKIQ